MATNAKTESKDAGPEIIPELPDDTEPVPRAAAAEPREREDDPAPPAGVEHVKDEARDSIAARYRELRDRKAAEAKANAEQAAAEAGEETTGEAGEGESLAAVGTEEGTEPPANTQPTPSEAAAPNGQATEIELLIDGKPKTVSLEEAKRLAQIQLAGDNRLDETKRLLKEATEVVANARRGQSPENQPDTAQTAQAPQNTQARTAPENRPAVAVDPEKLKAIAERIQVGTSEEGAEALLELVTSLAPKGTDEAAIDRAVTQRFNREAAQREINESLTQFAKTYKAIVDDPDLKTVGTDMVKREIIADLESVGIQAADIDPIRDNLAMLAHAQYNLRAGGHQVRSYADLLDTVGKKMTDKFVRPAPAPAPTTTTKPTAQSNAPAIEARNAAKRAAVQQPRATGVRTQLASAPAPKTRRDIINDARKNRGFGVTRH